jgi:hypothetical protein
VDKPACTAGFFVPALVKALLEIGIEAASRLWVNHDHPVSNCFYWKALLKAWPYWLIHK